MQILPIKAILMKTMPNVDVLFAATEREEGNDAETALPKEKPVDTNETGDMHVGGFSSYAAPAPVVEYIAPEPAGTRHLHLSSSTVRPPGLHTEPTLHAHSFELVHQKTVFFTIIPRKSQRSTMLRWLRCLRRVTGAAHVRVFHHQLCADRHNADGNGFNTSAASAASYVACCFSVFSLLRGTQRTSTMCPTAGAQALTMPSLMA